MWDFFVIGGDRRQSKLAELLLEDGHPVRHFGLGGAASLRGLPSSPEEAGDAACVVLPLPVTDEKGRINAPFAKESWTIEEILDRLHPEQLICGGRIGPELWEQARQRGLHLVDYFSREELMVANAVPTAEGALQVAMEEMPVTLCGARVLVLGYGRIGKLLTQRLRAMGSAVTVASRSFEEIAWAEAYGHRVIPLEGLSGKLGDFDLVCNTVPRLILTEPLLRQLKEGCLCVDLASRPGGTDFDAAAALGVRVVWALSLPGKVAPVTSARILRSTIYNILQETGERKHET